ncbi:hypothetical protein [Brevundimonas fontaquae]|uniref:Double-GTPase 1 domain-containing protein n=1 Tax=Brevundimonas fontaquae TaxID=2813778 RepID=A0ABX7LNS1_9CAUL|nr:hypothetical protein [Brevundimonas fontaquae]QSF53562.1 hypothetical protein JX001_12325 [Brevundimonas fontaquae]
MANTRTVILGLPESGKTTFLAALWHLMESEETDIGLVVDRVEGDQKYLNDIAAKWRTYQPVGRTSQVGDTDVSILVRNTATNETGELSFPDLAGEAFDRQIEDRRITPSYLTNFDGDDGVLLFIKVDRVDEEMSIAEMNELVGAPAEGGADKDASVDPDEVEWGPKLILNQARIVQILTDLLDRPFAVRPRRLAVILSAWDVLLNPPAPEDWLASNMPLVHQFLTCNRSMFETQVYGVSAQGLDLEKGDVSKMPHLTASKRITMVGNGARIHDLTAPLTWLMTG